MSEKVIQWQADTRCGLGVNDPIIGAPVGHWPLSESSATLVWNIELSKNVILLDAGGKTLALDFNDGEIAHQVPLILSEYRGTPTRPSSGTPSCVQVTSPPSPTPPWLSTTEIGGLSPGVWLRSATVESQGPVPSPRGPHSGRLAIL